MKHLKHINEEYKSEDLKKGIKHEKEHDKTYENIKKYYEKHKDFPGKMQVFEWIAKDHHDDFKKYYTELKKMEKENKSGGKDD